MKKFFQKLFREIITISKMHKNYSYAVAATVAVLIVGAFISGVAAGVAMIVLALLSGITILVLFASGHRDRFLYIVFIIAILIHLAAAIFVYATNFEPFSHGLTDATTYQQEAVDVYNHFHSGQFSLKDVSLTTSFPILIGSLYYLTIPSLIVGDLFVVWLAALSVLFAFLIAKKLGVSSRGSLVAGLIMTIYPSFIFYGSFLLKDTAITLACMIGLYLVLKLGEKFLWRNFIIFYIAAGILVNLRVYVGLALLLAFFASFFLILKMGLKKKLIYAVIVIFLIGFLPQPSGYGYYGMDFFKLYLQPETIAMYQNIYNPASPQSLSPNVPPSSVSSPASSGISTSTPVTAITPVSQSIGLDSSFVVAIDSRSPITFAISYFRYFCYILLGPFPWQLKYLRQYFVLFETIPWYFVLYFAIEGIIAAIKKRNKNVIPLLIFSLLVLGALTVFVSNFGIITRIRIPALVALLVFAPLGFKESKRLKFLS